MAPSNGQFTTADQPDRMKFEHSTMTAWITTMGLQKFIKVDDFLPGSKVWHVTLRNFEDNAQFLQLHEGNCKNVDEDLMGIARLCITRILIPAS
jgi:hypothetical protein